MKEQTLRLSTKEATAPAEKAVHYHAYLVHEPTNSYSAGDAKQRA